MRRRAAVLALLALAALGQEPGDPAGGEILFKEGQAAYRQRRYDDARRLFTEALARFEAAGEPTAAAWAVSWIGSCDLRSGRPEEALKLRREALRRLQGIHGDVDHLDVALSLNNVASVLCQLKRADEAVDLQRQALEMNRRLFQGDHPEIARCLNNLAESVSLAARYDEALALHEEALAMWRVLDDKEQVARSLSNYALCLSVAGRPAEALPLHEESLAIKQGLYEGDHPSTAIGLNNVGLTLRALGRSREALGYYQKSLAMRERLYRPDHRAIAICLNNCASCLRDLGRPADALPLYERALRIVRKAYRGPHPDVAQALNNLAVCLRTLGRTADALPCLEESLAICQQAYPKGHPDTARTLGNLGRCLQVLGHPADAEARLREALTMDRALFPGDHPRIAVDLDMLTGILLEREKVDEALACAQESVAILRRLHEGDHPDTGLALANLGRSLGQADRHAEAAAALEEALAMSRRLRDPQTHTWAATLALHHLDHGRVKEAIPLLAEAIAGIEALAAEARSLEDRDRSAYVGELARFQAFDLMIRAQVLAERPDEALRYLERGRARGFMDLLERSRFDPVAEAMRRARMRRDDATFEAMHVAERTRQAAEETMSRLVYELAEMAEEGAPRRVVKEKIEALAAARQEHQDALRERARLVRNVVPLTQPDPPETIQRGLEPRERMLVYALGDEESFALLVRPAGSSITAFHLHWPDGKPVTQRSVAGAVDAHHDIVAARGEAESLAERLFAALVPKEAWEELREMERAYVVPHGALHRLPFELLVPAAGRVWLDSGPPLVYAPSASVLSWCRRRSSEQLREELPYDMLALGDPAFGGVASAPEPETEVQRGLRERFGPATPLPGTRTEVLAIRDALGAERVAVLLGTEATEARLFDLAPQARMLHVATHQLVDEKDGGSYSRLLLASPEEPTPEDDGSLRLHEVLDRWRDRLSACSLVVLSACETQRGPLQRDEGVYALPLGFMYAGCPSVIGSLWRVDDESTAELMRRFYVGLGAGKGTLEAFTAARRELRKEHANPYFWAPFIFIGDPR